MTAHSVRSKTQWPSIAAAAQILKGDRHVFAPNEERGLVRAACSCGWSMYRARCHSISACDDWDFHVLLAEGSDGVGGGRDRLTAVKGK